MDSNVNKILQNIVNTATLAADEAKAAVHSAGKAVAGKYDEVKMNIELARLSDEQEDVFLSLIHICVSDVRNLEWDIKAGLTADPDTGRDTPFEGVDFPYDCLLYTSRCV